MFKAQLLPKFNHLNGQHLLTTLLLPILVFCLSFINLPFPISQDPQTRSILHMLCFYFTHTDFLVKMSVMVLVVLDAHSWSAVNFFCRVLLMLVISCDTTCCTVTNLKPTKPIRVQCKLHVINLRKSFLIELYPFEVFLRFVYYYIPY